MIFLAILGFPIGGTSLALQSRDDVQPLEGFSATAPRISNFSISNARTVTEGQTLVFQVSGRNNSRENIRISVSAADLRRMSSPSFTLLTSRLDAKPGAFAGTVRVRTIDLQRVTSQAQRTIRVTLSNSSRLVQFSDAIATGNVRNKPEPVPEPVFSIRSARAVEGSPLVFRVSMSGSAASTDRFFTLPSDGTAKARTDYTRTRQNIRFRAGSRVSISVPTIDNDEVDSSRSMTLVLYRQRGNSRPQALTRAQGIITNDDRPPPPRFSIGSATPVTEGGILRFPITGTNTGRGTIRLSVSALGLPQNSPTFFRSPGFIDVQPGSRAPPLIIRTIADPAENGSRAIRVTIAPARGIATIGRGSATARVIDNPVDTVTEPPPTSTEPPTEFPPDIPPVTGDLPSFSIGDASAPEGGRLTFAIIGQNTSDEPVVLTVAVLGAIEGDAEPLDQITVAPGMEPPPFTFDTICNDVSQEPRSITVTLGASEQNASIGRARAVGTITNLSLCGEEPPAEIPPEIVDPPGGDNDPIWPIIAVVAAGVAAAAGAGWLLIPTPGMSMTMRTGTSSFTPANDDTFALPAISTKFETRYGEADFPDPLPIQSPEEPS